MRANYVPAEKMSTGLFYHYGKLTVPVIELNFFNLSFYVH